MGIKQKEGHPLDKSKWEGWVRGIMKHFKDVVVATHTQAGFSVMVSPKDSAFAATVSERGRENFIGTHSAPCRLDVQSAAAYMQTSRFLISEHDGQTFYQLSLERDEDLGMALDVDFADQFFDEVLRVNNRNEVGECSQFAKQVFWGDRDDAPLLCIMFPLSFMDAVRKEFKTEHGEENQKARTHYFGKTPYPSPYAYFPEGWWRFNGSENPEWVPGYSVINIGDSKPQNIGIFNNDRHGEAIVLPAFPYNYKEPPAVRAPYYIDNFLKLIDRNKEFEKLVERFNQWLDGYKPNNAKSKAKRNEFLVEIMNSILEYSNPVWNEVKPGWSQDPRCRLPAWQKVWLDSGTDADCKEWANEMEGEIVAWLSRKLGSLPDRPANPLTPDDNALVRKFVQIGGPS